MKGRGASLLFLLGMASLIWGSFIWLIELPAVHASPHAQAAAYPYLLAGVLIIGAALFAMLRR